jgi:adenylate cyclase, class 2
MEEFEVKYLDINPEEIEKKLVAIGAKKVFDKLYRVKIFDYPDLRLNNDEAAWVRLRDEGDEITLTFKQRYGMPVINGKLGGTGETNDGGMKEIEVIVDDFEKTAQIFYAVGMIDKFIEEKRRVRYQLDDIEFDIDYMPGLNPFLEIESTSMARVEEGIKLLGLNPDEKKIFSAFQIYALNGINMLDYKAFLFSGLIKKEQ